VDWILEASDDVMGVDLAPEFLAAPVLEAGMLKVESG
jgi:hypothetical protein